MKRLFHLCTHHLFVIASEAKQSVPRLCRPGTPGCFALLAMTAFLFLLFLCSAPVSAEVQEGETSAGVPSQSDCDRAAILDLRVMYEDTALSGLVAPPPGVYPFQPGDGVVLRAYGTGEIPVNISWTGDASGTGETLYVDMDVCKKITVTFSRAAAWPDKEEPPWFDVPENKNMYAFVGGGDLYGWFAASRDQTKGAGITHLTHKDAFLSPIVHFTSLNFEHIFSGMEADNYRASFTPRTDPMRFRVESPGTVRVQWPSKGASWDLDSEMVYRFTEGDEIDMEFHTIPGNEAFSQGYVGFMWATYHSHFTDHVIHFPGYSGEREGWMRFGPSIAEDQFGGAVAFQGIPPLSSENGATAFNIVASEEMFFTEPVYYGEIDLSVSDSNQQLPLTCIMMFDQVQAIRFAVWNWGDPPTVSAWDWQYILRNPQPGQRAGYRARMDLAAINAPDAALIRYHAWRNSLDAVSLPEITSYPVLPIYWSPASILFDPLVVGECIERVNPDQALALYREVLLLMHDAPRTAAQMDNLLSRRYSEERRVEEWLRIREHQEHWPDSPLLLLHLGKAYHAIGDIAAAMSTLRQGLEHYTDDAALLFFQGELLLETGETAPGLECLAQAISLDPKMAGRAGIVVAGYAEAVLNDGNLVQAELLYREATGLAPDEHWHKVHLAEVLQQQGRDEEAEVLYRTVLMAAPESAYTAQRVDGLYAKREDIAGHIAFWREIQAQHAEAVIPALHLGKAYYYGGDYANAESVLDAAHEATPDNADIRFYLGATLLQTDNLENGIALIEKAVAGNPLLEEPAATLFAGRAAAALETDNYVLAEMLYRRASALVPDDVWYSVYLGETLEEQGEDAEALTLFLSGMNAEPESPYIADLINNFFATKENTDGRIEAWRQIVAQNPDASLPQIQLVRACYEGERYDQAATVASEIEALRNNPEFMLYRCASLLYLDSVDDGAACLLALAEQDSSYAPRIGQALAARATKAGQAGDSALAERLYRHAMSVAPDELWHTVRLGETLEQLGRDDEALSLYRKVLIAVPDSPYTSNRIHGIFLRRNEPVGRIHFWRDIWEQHPDVPASHLHLARAYYEAGNFSDALAVADAFALTPAPTGLAFYRCAAQLHLHNTEDAVACLISVATQDTAYTAPAAKALALRGEEAAASEDATLAEVLYRHAVTLSPDDLGYVVRLGEITEELGNHEEALALYMRVLLNAQEAPRTAARLDALLMRVFAAERRVAVWKEINEKRPDAALLMLYLGKAQEDAGNREAAVEAYRAALQRDGTLKEAEAALERLGAQ